MVVRTRNNRPLRIGVSSCIFHQDPERPIFKDKSLLYAEESMVRWLLLAGTLPVLIPRLTTTEPVGVTLEEIMADCDGLLLQGGVDVSPHSYGETPLSDNWQGDRLRDEYEIALIQEAFRQGKPILGICRGLQILNVACGGSLYQDISTQIAGSFEHRNWEIYEDNNHLAKIHPGTALAKLYPDRREVMINSIHHQSIKDLAPGFVAECTSASDGVIEAIRYQGPEPRYAVGVQWHPEFQRDSDDHLLPRDPIMEDFLYHVTHIDYGKTNLG